MNDARVEPGAYGSVSGSATRLLTGLVSGSVIPAYASVAATNEAWTGYSVANVDVLAIFLR